MANNWDNKQSEIKILTTLVNPVSPFFFHFLSWGNIYSCLYWPFYPFSSHLKIHAKHQGSETMLWNKTLFVSSLEIWTTTEDYYKGFRLGETLVLFEHRAECQKDLCQQWDPAKRKPHFSLSKTLLLPHIVYCLGETISGFFWSLIRGLMIFESLLLLMSNRWFLWSHSFSTR